MRHKTLIIKLFIAIGCFSASLAFASELTRDTIIAIVNKEAITYKDLQQYLSAVSMQLVAQGHSEDEIRQMVDKSQEEGLHRLIEDRLLVAEADKKEVTIKDFAIDERLAEVKKNYASNDNFMKDLMSQGLTISDLRKKIMDQIKAKYIVDTEVRAKVYIHPNEVNEFYKQNQDKFIKPEQADLDSIFIPYEDNTQSALKEDLGLKSENVLSGKNDKLIMDLSSNSLRDLSLLGNNKEGGQKASANEKAQEVIAAYKSGADFGELVKKYSSMPSLGKIGRGELLPEIENSVFALKEGEVSAPISSENGIFIFRLKAKIPGGTTAFDETKDQIYKILYAQKFQKRFNEFVDDLKKKAYIEIKN